MIGGNEGVGPPTASRTSRSAVADEMTTSGGVGVTAVATIAPGVGARLPQMLSWTSSTYMLARPEPPPL